MRGIFASPKTRPSTDMTRNKQDFHRDLAVTGTINTERHERSKGGYSEIASIFR